MKHTPGPWRVLDHDWRAVVGADGLVVADVRVREDARLIAAAPELLHAAGEALNALMDYVPAQERKGASLHYGKSVIAALLVAIAKAEER